MLSANSAVVRVLESNLTKADCTHILRVARTKKVVQQSGEAAVRVDSVQINGDAVFGDAWLSQNNLCPGLGAERD
jgi:hypothetical protein